MKPDINLFDILNLVSNSLVEVKLDNKSLGFIDITIPHNISVYNCFHEVMDVKVDSIFVEEPDNMLHRIVVINLNKDKERCSCIDKISLSSLMLLIDKQKTQPLIKISHAFISGKTVEVQTVTTDIPDHPFNKVFNFLIKILVIHEER